MFLTYAFSRLKSSKRQFYVLDDRHWRLFFYRCEEDFRSSKPPLGSIALSEAAINLTSSEDVHQFVVHSEGKEHILTAESHRAMMTWALALQTSKKLFKQQPTDSKDLAWHLFATRKEKWSVAVTSRNRNVSRMKIQRNPKRSIRKVAREMGINQMSLNRIVRSDINLRPDRE
ncbi:uncharacterized protein NPIL_592471 [Nephila pilipes]|uniref:PH domain-containing protein n=1 Tax=Nephila pilipes TaxID=299642 RepID=A0A8X6UDL6_NEPPI|nr:uncharacterized protein NPIL_592471 [Nephila pilipes]